MAVWKAVAVAAGWNLGLGRFRDARVWCAVWASAIVVIRPLPKDAPEVAFTEWDEVVEAFAANRAEKALAECIRLWAAEWGFQTAHTEAG